MVTFVAVFRSGDLVLTSLGRRCSAAVTGTRILYYDTMYSPSAAKLKHNHWSRDNMFLTFGVSHSTLGKDVFQGLPVYNFLDIFWDGNTAKQLPHRNCS